jgi:hypothetical protein
MTGRLAFLTCLAILVVVTRSRAEESISVPGSVPVLSPGTVPPPPAAVPEAAIPQPTSPAPAPWPEPAPAPALVDQPRSYRHFLGLQVGGTLPIALYYRYRLLEPLFLEVGGFGAPEATALFTGGIVVAFHQSDRLMVYSGAGGSACLLGDNALAFLYGRLGLGVGLGARRQQMLSVDAGVWSGRLQKRDHDTQKLTTDKWFTIPMAGLSYSVGLGKD